FRLRPDRRRNGGARGCRRRCAHGLRHVQGSRQRHRDPRAISDRENRREERRLPPHSYDTTKGDWRGEKKNLMTPTGSKSVRLLVAEDNPLVRDLIGKGLESHCEVVFANDGADALLKVIDEPPDAILCDYKMPGLDGRQLFEKLRGREKTRHIPFLFMASRADI